MTAPAKVSITGAGVISSLGDTPESFGESLAAGRSGIGPVELFPPEALGCGVGGEVKGFDPKRYLGEGNLRPLDRVARLAASAATGALAAAGISPEERQRRGVGLALGTMFGSVHTISEFDQRALKAGPNYAKPLDFANSVINAAAGQTAIWHGLPGVNSTISGGTVSGLEALAYAADLVRWGRVEALLAGGVDELCFASSYGFEQAGYVAGCNGIPPKAVPYDAKSGGFLPGEGAALLVLEAGKSDAPTPQAEILGHGSCYDPTRGTDPASATRAVASAIRTALADAAVDPGSVDAVSASGSGRPAGDRAELAGIAEVLGAEVPVTAVKSMVGECLGASGAFQTLALLRAMATGVLPGIRGLEEPFEERFWPMLSAAPRKVAVRCGVAVALGLDGNACALVLGSGAAA